MTFHHVTIRPEAIALYRHPAKPIHTIRTHIREAIADVWGTDHIPESATGYQPHLSIAYVNTNTDSAPTVKAVSVLKTEVARLILTSASCIALQRVNRAYHWNTHATVPLAE